MAFSASTGARVHLGPINSTADDEADYAALPYTEIEGVETIGEFGDVAASAGFSLLAEGRARKLSGARDAGDMALVVAHDPLAAGQAACTAAAATKFSYAVKVELADEEDGGENTSFYFRALIGQARLNPSDANSVARRAFTLHIDSVPVEASGEAPEPPIVPRADFSTITGSQYAALLFEDI